MTQVQGNQKAVKTMDRLADYFERELIGLPLSSQSAHLNLTVLLMDSLKPTGNGTFAIKVSPDQAKILRLMEEAGI